MEKSKIRTQGLGKYPEESTVVKGPRGIGLRLSIESFLQIDSNSHHGGQRAVQRPSINCGWGQDNTQIGENRDRCILAVAVSTEILGSDPWCNGEKG